MLMKVITVQTLVKKLTMKIGYISEEAVGVIFHQILADVLKYGYLIHNTLADF